MSDFMHWLYIYYIEPQLEAAPRNGCEQSLTRMEGAPSEEDRRAYQKAREWTACEAFMLGLHTGQGLSEAYSRWLTG